MLKEDVEEGESRYDLVLLIQFNGVDLLHLPPLQQDHTQRRELIPRNPRALFVTFLKCSLNSIREVFVFFLSNGSDVPHV